MDRPLYAPRGKYVPRGYNQFSRRMGRSFRVFLLQSSIKSAEDYAPIDVDLYWVSDTDGYWRDAANWSLTTGGAGGAGVPDNSNQVTFDGEGTGKCTLNNDARCKELIFNESAAQVNANFDQNGYAISCSTFAYNCANNTSTVFDAAINLSGATFVVTAMQADGILASASIFAAASISVTSTDDTAIPVITAAADIETLTAMTVARLIMSTPGSTLTFLNGVDFTLTAYTAGDWDGDAVDDMVIVSDDATVWGFVNPASMVVAYINVQDSNATNEVDATDNCVDGTGNTNWTFV